MKMHSTRGLAPPVGASEALAAGLAPDGGLYVPALLPVRRIAEFDPDASLAELATLLLQLAPSRYQFSETTFDFSADLAESFSAAASGAPLMTITYAYRDAAKSPDVMTLYAGSTRRVNVDINGVIEFDMRASFVDALKLACQHTVSGGAIEENW